MITITCPSCQRTFTVPDSARGRTGKCHCGARIAIPGQHEASAPIAAITAPGIAPPTVAQAAPQLPMRTRRLIADAQQMSSALAGSSIIRLHSQTGAPAEDYVIDYLVRGLKPGKGNQPAPCDAYRVQIHLTSDYPRLGPQCKMLTPVFHPNIDQTTICVGDHWTAGERLIDLVLRIGEMLAYQAYNVKSPLNAEAAMWADLNADQLPTDHRNLRPPEF